MLNNKRSVYPALSELAKNDLFFFHPGLRAWVLGQEIELVAHRPD